MERQSGVKLELVAGRVVAMAGASLPHNEIQRNVARCLELRAPHEGCGAYSSDLAIATVSQVGDEVVTGKRYADVVYACHPLERSPEHPDLVANPVVLVEVLSEGNTSKEMTEKRRQYFAIPSLMHYLELSSLKRDGRLWSRGQDGRWLAGVSLGAADAIDLFHIGIRLTMEEAYRRSGLP